MFDGLVADDLIFSSTLEAFGALVFGEMFENKFQKWAKKS